MSPKLAERGFHEAWQNNWVSYVVFTVVFHFRVRTGQQKVYLPSSSQPAGDFKSFSTFPSYSILQYGMITANIHSFSKPCMYIVFWCSYKPVEANPTSPNEWIQYNQGFSGVFLHYLTMPGGGDYIPIYIYKYKYGIINIPFQVIWITIWDSQIIELLATPPAGDLGGGLCTAGHSQQHCRG